MKYNKHQKEYNWWVMALLQLVERTMKKQNEELKTKKQKKLSLREKAIMATNARSEESDTHNSDWNPGSLSRLDKALKEES